MRSLKSSLLAYLAIPAFSTLLLASCTSAGPSAADGDDDEAVGEAHGALTPEQCNYFDVNGTVQICHKTSSGTKPYTIVRISDQACINGHSAHAGDYVTSLDPSSPLYDPTCGGLGCLAVNAPCDATVPCCDGLTCQSGTCTDVDECALGTDNCDANAACTNTTGSFTCACNAGYSGDGVTCTDVDECALGTDNCGANAACTNTPGSFTCACDAGYSGDGITCTDVDECALGADNCGANAACTNTPGSFTCACDAGYSGDGITCTDVDECALGTDNCGANAACTNTPGSFTCACDEGYSGDGVTCTDVDECAAATANCDANATCTNTSGSFTCACDAGYEGDGVTCTGIDPCAPNPCQNGGTCTGGINSYTCECALTYEGANCEACEGGLADCNGLTSDGCEVNLESDASHCNACNLACATGEICSNGGCQTPPTGQVPGTPINVSDPHNPLAPAVADVNGDGKLDILVANGESGSLLTPSGSLSVFHGNGDATVQPELYSTGAPLSSNAVVAVDVDGDGWLDAVTVDGQANLPLINGSISVYRNLGPSAPGTFGAPTSFTTGSPGSVHLCTGDFDHDGAADIATTSVTLSRVSVIFGTGAGSFGAPVLIPIVGTGGVQSTIACRDLNGDGFSDIVVTSPASARLSILINQGNGSFAAPVAYANSANGQTAGIAFGDADGDGKLDILSNGAAGRFLFFFKGNGSGTFASGVQSAAAPSPIANSALGVVASDFNGDGKLDAYILVTTSSGGVRPMTGNGSGAFTSGPVVPTGASPGLNAIAAADLDGDGYDDLVLTNRASGTVTVIPNGL
ncbi:FG-GAP-like repeat-containing protein [Sorangium sp. So ce321]|uniref:FG-GAP-like repeat-containing protein n=1 Tax=Sorangium sp. So ce321 TaxID=3133300 RepID=UPI003F63F6AA